MRSERGFTLVEIAVSLALVVFVSLGAMSGVFFLVRANRQAVSRLPNLNGVQSGGRWLSRDAEMAKSSSLVDGAQPVDLASTPVTFYRTDYYNEPHTSHTTTYSLTGSTLQRNEDGQVSTVARNVTAATLSLSGKIVTAVVTASDQSRNYWATLRAQ